MSVSLVVIKLMSAATLKLAPRMGTAGAESSRSQKRSGRKDSARSSRSVTERENHISMMSLHSEKRRYMKNYKIWEEN